MNNTINKWSAREKQLMQRFIDDHPNEKLTTVRKHPFFETGIPERTAEAIYHGWRRAKGWKKNVSTRGEVKLNSVSTSFMHELDIFLQGYIEKKVSEKVSAMMVEIEELRALLRKLTKVREAVEEFKL